MSKIISLTVIMTSMVMMGYLMFRNARVKNSNEKMRFRIILQLTVCSLLALTWLFVGDSSCFGVTTGLWLTLFAFVVHVSTCVSSSVASKVSYSVVLIQILWGIINIVGKLYYPKLIGTELTLVMTVVEGTACVLVFTLSYWSRLRDIKSLMTTGSAWSNVESAVDSVYVMFLLLYPLISLWMHVVVPGVDAIYVLVLLPELGMMAALCIRMSHDVRFIIMQHHETLILESLKVSQLEISGTSQSDVYRELYDRVVSYFEKEKPFLNSKLTINDVARVVYSNRLYMSRAISQCTGRNFCQFVNYYRISFAVECFRNNPDLKVGELSEMSGFNSPVTFNVAFHLFLNDNPSDWFRKERVKILNKKK